MKSKPVIYLLGFMVLCIWGIIVYRIYVSVHGDATDGLPISRTEKLKKEKVPKLYPDTFKLLLDYPDPFTGAAARKPAAIRPLARVSGVVPLLKPAIPALNPVQQLKYLGYVANGKGDRLVAIVSYQGKEKMMKEGDTLKQMKVLKIKKDAVMVSYQGKKALIKTD